MRPTYHRVVVYLTSSNQRLGEYVRSKMDSQSVTKEHDRRHTMLFNMPQMDRNREERNLITPRFGGQLCDEPKEHLSAK